MRLLRLRRAHVSAAVGLLAALALASGAWAYFTSTGTGTASASVGNLSSPTLSATPGAGVVSLSWTTVTPPGSGAVSYYVTRDGGVPAGTCPTSSSPTAATSCTDNGVSAGQHSYAVTAVWRGWTGTSSTKAVTLSSGALDHLLVSGYPTSTTAGVSHTATVTAKDASGNTVTSYAGTIHFTSSDGAATLPGDYVFVAGDTGTHTFSATLKTSGSQSITATDTTSGSITGSQTGITVTATATTLALSAAAGNPSAGAADNLTVTAKDALGNTDTGYTGSHTLTFSGASASPNSTQPTVANTSGTAIAFGSATTVSFTSGQATVSGSSNGQMKLYKAGSTSLTVSDGAINSTASPLSVFVNSAGVTVAYSSGCPIAMAKNSTVNLSISIPNDAFGNPFTSQASSAFGLALNSGTNFGFGTATGSTTAALNVTTGPANNGFAITTTGAGKTANLTMPTVPAGFTAPGTCVLNSGS
jgi:hypothetical protein